MTYHRYDGADRLSAIVQAKRVGATETVVAGQALTRGMGGTINKIETYRSGTYDSASGQFSASPAKTQAFEYDANARLTRETRSSVQGTITVSIDTAYEYNAVGNRTKKTQTTAAGVEITTYGYDSADRLTNESTTLPGGGSRTTTYAWDGNGNLASKTEPGKTTLYRFDPHNRLIDIRTGAAQAEASAAAPSVSYAYDASGNRIRKTTNQGSTGYLIDPSHAYAQVALEAQGSQGTAYVWGHGLVRQGKVNGASGENLFPLRGHLGTSLGAVDVDGNLVEQTEGDAFGILDQLTGAKQAHLYAGEYWDQDSQLLYLRARWYDPRVGRFISADPFEGKQRDPRSLNRYSYAHSDPVHGRDPSGRMNLGDTMAAITMGAALVGATYYGIQSTLQAVAPETSPHRKFGLWDSIAVQYVESSASNTVADEIEQERRRQPDRHGHHTIPVYLCGAVVQPKYANITPSEHGMIHTQIAGIALTIQAAEEYAYKTLGRIRMWEVLKIAHTDPGRAAIARALEGVYRAGWWNTGAPNTIGDAFTVSKPGYVSGAQTSLPWCSRSGNP